MNVLELVAVDLDLAQAWLVGAPDDGLDINLTSVTRRALGDPAVPATGLVGALRDHLGGAATTWLGPDLGAHGEAGAEPTAPSPLRALGTLVAGRRTVTTSTTTAVDDWSGAAAAGSLRTTEHVDPGSGLTTVRWFLVLDQPAAGADVEDLLERLARWQPFVGRGRSVGRGQATVSRVRRCSVDLDVPADLTWWLADRKRWFVPPDVVPSGPAGEVKGREGDGGRPDPVLDIGWTITSPLHVGNGQALGGTSPAPSGRRSAESAAVRRDADGTPIVPGTAWKGIFRHRASFILSTLADAGLIPTADTTSTIERLFGSVSARGVLRFHTSRVRPGLEASVRQETRTHVAINRLTGGAERALLFSREYVRDGELDLRVESSQPLTASETALLWHVVRDLHDGLIGVGGASRSGYGSLALVDSGRLAQAPTDVLPGSDDAEVGA